MWECISKSQLNTTSDSLRQLLWKNIENNKGFTYIYIYIYVYIYTHTHIHKGFPGGSVLKNLPASARDVSSIPELWRSPRVGNGNQCQYSYLGNPMDIELGVGYSPWSCRELHTTAIEHAHTHAHTHTHTYLHWNITQS